MSLHTKFVGRLRRPTNFVVICCLKTPDDKGSNYLCFGQMINFRLRRLSEEQSLQGFRTLFVGICLLLGFFSQAEAQEKRSLAVLPYVNIGVSEENIVRISSAFAQELVSKYRYLVKEGDSIRQKLSSIPDGCPNDTTCVARITQLLQVEQLLFFSAIDSGSSIEVSLIHVFGEKLKTAKVSLQGISSADWKKEIRTGLSQFFGTPKLTQPKSNKKTLLFLAIGTVLLGSSVTGFLLLQPTLGRVPE